MKLPMTGLIGAGLFSLSMMAQAVDTRTLNNGNLVLEDIPQIPQSLVDDLNRYSDKCGDRFKPCQLLVDMANSQKRFYS